MSDILKFHKEFLKMFRELTSKYDVTCFEIITVFEVEKHNMLIKVDQDAEAKHLEERGHTGAEVG